MKTSILATILPAMFGLNLSMTAESQSAAFDSLLDGTLDDIADLPSFAAWPAGAYRALLPEGFKQKLINEKPVFELKLVNKEVLEISNAAETDEAPKVDDECSVAFGIDTDIGKGFFKEALTPFINALGLTADQAGAVRAGVESSKGMEVIAVMKRRVVKKDGEEKIYPTLVKIEIL